MLYTKKDFRKDFRNKPYQLGDYTYFSKKPEILDLGDGEANLYIGKFCSIAQYVKIFLCAEHRLDWVSTYPPLLVGDKASKIKGHPATKGDVVIDNDVWIGLGTFILSGVRIASGAVIGAGTVVANDVEPYSIVAGNPGKLIKKRFDENTIEKLMEIRWWDWPIEKIREHADIIWGNSPDELIRLHGGVQQRNHCYSSLSTTDIQKSDPCDGKAFTEYFIKSAMGAEKDKEKQVNNTISPVSYKKREAYHSYISPYILSMIEGHPQRILEVGCAEGSMGQAIKEKHQCEYIGLEINRESCAKAETRLDRAIVADVEKTDLKDYGLSEKGFDYIIYGDVLEHLYDPWAVICEHKQFLKDNGYIVASIPNIRNLEIIQSLVNGNWTYKEEGILDSTHLRFFTFAEIKKMFTNCGYTITDVKHNMQRFFELDKIQGHINIDLPKLTIKNVTKEEAIEFSTIQFIVKARKSVSSESDRPILSEQDDLKSEKLADSPQVSICIPTFNGEEFLSEAIASALSQTYPNIEIIVSDDGSTDKTVEIAKSFQEKSPIPFTVIPHENYGLAQNWNFCISQAKGKYIKFLHQDDVLEPDCVKEMLTVAEQDDEIGLVFSARGLLISEAAKTNPACLSDYRNANETYKHWSELKPVQPGQKLLNDPNLLRNPINKIGEPTTVLIDRNVFDKVGVFDPDLCQLIDVEMWLRIMSQFKIGFVDKILSHWRLHPRQTTRHNAQSRERILTDYRKFYEKIQGNARYPERLRREVSQHLGLPYHHTPQPEDAPESDKDNIEKAKDFSRQGSELLSKGDTEGALNAFTKALELNPNFTGAHNNLAILYWQTGHPQKAADHFSKALQLDPNDRNTVINCTELLKFHNRIEDAKTLCSSYLQRNPGDPVVTQALKRLREVEQS